MPEKTDTCGDCQKQFPISNLRYVKDAASGEYVYLCKADRDHRKATRPTK